MKKFERILKGLANHRRLAILKFLHKTKEANVSEIAGVIGLSFKATSKHLNILANLDIVEKQQRSLEMFYRLARKFPPMAKNVITYISNSRE
ncbi:MAG: winged helix-turn-helix transcriptional regulator [Candidatus Sungiibacteriota bacterium]|uniref:Winged helix-turn-helix transcriptional regulator n=1 Tax=Candidatus Sungiibacteriota bacterium TaxID=2750080 RepID=A0A7T5URY2_9BACT|nr:MAG: winged helix-turn-helix transcriptional regulator [Candidatus Sungbacteria bacterium]